jgi:hypothetical protein
MATSKKAKREDATPMPISRAKERLSEYLSDKSPEEIVATLADIQQHPDYLGKVFKTPAAMATEARYSTW